MPALILEQEKANSTGPVDGLVYISHNSTHDENAVEEKAAKAAPRADRREVHLLAMTTGRVLEVKAKGFSQVGGGRRGEVSSTWSRQSRSRLVKRAESVDWDELGDVYFVTLTYPDMPKSGEDCKRHFKNWGQRWRRRFGSLVGMWKLEFQRRGVPHYHLVVKAPEGEPLNDVQQWVSRSWYEVVGSGNEKHLRAGTECKQWTSGSAGDYFAKYGTQRGKEYQNTAPEGYWTGRWWGVFGELPETREVVKLDKQEFFQLRRVMRRLSASRGVRRRESRTFQGMWIRGDGLRRAIAFVKGLLEPLGSCPQGAEARRSNTDRRADNGALWAGKRWQGAALSAAVTV